MAGGFLICVQSSNPVVCLLKVKQRSTATLLGTGRIFSDRGGRFDLHIHSVTQMQVCGFCAAAECQCSHEYCRRTYLVYRDWRSWRREHAHTRYCSLDSQSLLGLSSHRKMSSPITSNSRGFLHLLLRHTSIPNFSRAPGHVCCAVRGPV